MNTIKYGFLAAAATLMLVPEVQGQSYTQRGTRNGAIAGAIIGGLVGANRDRPIAGAAIGGLIGGATGRAIGSSKDSRYYGGQNFGGHNHGHNFAPTRGHHGNQFNNGFSGHQRYDAYRQISRPAYGGGFYGNGFQGGGGYGGGFGGYSPYARPSSYARPSCPYSRW